MMAKAASSVFAMKRRLHAEGGKHGGQISPGYHYYLRANMEAPEPTPTFNAPDADAIGKVKDVALDKAQDLFAQGKAKLDKVRHLDIHDASACLAV
jgi:hypothetical protein